MFRFTIRDVLWVTVVVAMGVVWWLEHRTSTTWNQRANAAGRALQDAQYESNWYGNGVVVRHPSGYSTVYSGGSEPRQSAP